MTTAPSIRKSEGVDLVGVRVVPNPYVGGAGWELRVEDRRVSFVNLTAHCRVRVYTLADDHVVTLHHDSAERGFCYWNLQNKEGLPVAYGLYLYMVETPEGRTHRGKFAVVRKELMGGKKLCVVEGRSMRWNWYMGSVLLGTGLGVVPVDLHVRNS